MTSHAIKELKLVSKNTNTTAAATAAAAAARRGAVYGDVMLHAPRMKNAFRRMSAKKKQQHQRTVENRNSQTYKH